MTDEQDFTEVDRAAQARRIATLTRAEQAVHYARQARAEQHRESSRGALLLFHLIAAAAAAAGCVLWAVSFPGYSVVTLIAGVLGSALVALVWLGWVVAVAARTMRLWRWFAVAPVIGALTAGLIAVGAPLHLRWAAARGAFAGIVAGHPVPPAGSGWAEFAVPGRIGSYPIVAAYWVPGGALFFGTRRSYPDDAGFAYLPAGAAPMEHTAQLPWPTFRPLGGGWYHWTAGAD